MTRLYLIPLCGNWLDCVWEKITNWVGDQVKWLIDMIFQPILEAIANAVTIVMGTIGTFWVHVPTIAVGTPTMGSGPGQPASGTVQWMWQHTQYIAFFVAVIGVLIAGIKMAYSQRGESAREILRSLITLGVASLLAVGVTQALIEFGDEFSKCIVTTSLADDPNSKWLCEPGELVGKGKSFGTAMSAMLAVSATAGPMGIGLAISIGILAIIAGVIQIVLMVVRSALLILLVGMLPIAAAATGTEMGRNWFKKILGWLFAFVLYKPVAAIIYATAIRLTSNNGGLNFATGDEAARTVMNMVTGLTLLVLALFALPGLMRFIVPMVAATAGNAGAGMIAAKLVGADKLAGKLQDSLQGEGSSGSEGGSSDGPTGSKNVGKAKQQPPSSSGPPGGGATGGTPGATSGASTGATSGAGGTAGAVGGGGGGAAGGAAAGGGAAAAAGPVAAVAAPIAIVAAGVKATKQAGEMAAQETLGDDGPQGSGDSEGGSPGGPGGGGGDGPSGSGGPAQNPRRPDAAGARARANDDRRDQDRRDDRRDSDGPRGSS